MNPLLFVVTTCLLIAGKHAENPDPLSSLNSPMHTTSTDELVDIPKPMDVLLPHEVAHTDFTLDKKDLQPWDASQLLPILIQMEKLSKKKGTHITISDLLDEAGENFKRGNIYFERKDYAKAEAYYQKALDMAITQPGKYHMSMWKLYSNLGVVKHILGNDKQGKIWLEKALAICETQPEKDYMGMCVIYTNLGTLVYTLGNDKQGKIWLEKALAICETQLSEEDIDRSILYVDLGFVYGRLGNHTQAKVYLEKALPIYTANAGEDHIDVANIYFSLAVAHLKLGNHTQAKMYLEKALPMYIANVGEDYIGVAKIYFSLAVAHLNLGNHIQAKIYFKKAFDIYKEKLGNYHFNTVRTYFVLSVLPFYPYMLAVSYGLCIAIFAYASYRLPKRCRCPQKKETLPLTYQRVETIDSLKKSQKA